MSDKKPAGLPFGSEDAAESELWRVLGTLEAGEPSAQLRQGFYRKLEEASRPTLAMKLRDFLGFSGNAGWVTAAASLVAGLVVGQMVSAPELDAGGRLAALEQNVSMLNRTLILDRLRNEEPGKRLRGVMDAAYLAAEDDDIARTLLNLATSDRVDSIRSAAVESLGSQINTPGIGAELMDTLKSTTSPLVQLALIDLVLRNGSDERTGQLLQLADDGLLHADLSRHVYTSLGRDST